MNVLKKIDHQVRHIMCNQSSFLPCFPCFLLFSVVSCRFGHFCAIWWRVVHISFQKFWDPRFSAIIPKMFLFTIKGLRTKRNKRDYKRLKQTMQTRHKCVRSSSVELLPEEGAWVRAPCSALAPLDILHVSINGGTRKRLSHAKPMDARCSEEKKQDKEDNFEKPQWAPPDPQSPKTTPATKKEITKP